MIANVDDAIGRLVDYLDASRHGDHTIVVLTSDHGEMLGSHGLWDKMLPFAESLDIPLILRCPRRLPAGRRSDALYTPMDHMPTLCGLAGITAPASAEGIDLTPAVLGGRARERDVALIMSYVSDGGTWFNSGTDWPEWRGLRSKTHTYCKWLDGREALYDNRRDPYQLRNLAKDPQHQTELEAMRRRLGKELAIAHDEFLPGTAYADWYDNERNLVRTALGPVVPLDIPRVDFLSNAWRT